jgi:hypothetical protein
LKIPEGWSEAEEGYAMQWPKEKEQTGKQW